jgi:hypothetical protein
MFSYMATPEGFEPVENLKLPRFQRRAIKRATKLDREFFRQNPVRLTRVRRAVDGETGEVTVPDKQSFVLVRLLDPGHYHKLLGFSDIDLVELASSENAASWLYEMFRAIKEHRQGATNSKRASKEKLEAAPAEGEA